MVVRRLFESRYWMGLLVLLVALAGGCSDQQGSGQKGAAGRAKLMSYEDAVTVLGKLKGKIKVTEIPVGQVELSVTTAPSMAATLPDIDTFPLVVDPVADGASVVAEVFTSTEKSGSGPDGWMVEVAEQFNAAGRRTAAGKRALIAVRKIASGTAYEFISSRKYVPDGFSPSNELWVAMARAHGMELSRISERLVGNVAGLVMKTPVAERLKAGKAQISVADLVDAAIQGKVVVGYTNPFASSTGLNFLVTVLETFAKGDEAALLSPAVASAFENFQKSVPFVALTTMQMRDSVEKDGSLEAFVMEYQTFTQTASLRSGYEFIPFGCRHDNPLYAVGQVTPEKKEVLELFAKFAGESQAQALADRYGFNPRFDWQSSYPIPPGDVLIEAQQLWKRKKDAGRPIAAVFLADVSGSMGGMKIRQLRQALIDGSNLISPQNAIGLVAFSSNVSVLLPIKPFQLLQKAAFQAAAGNLQAEGNTAMYDGIVVALSMLVDYKQANPAVRPMLFVLTDGETNRGLQYEKTADMIAGLRVPIYTIGFEADVKELGRLSSLVEAASLDASEADLRYKIGAMLNSQM